MLDLDVLKGKHLKTVSYLIIEKLLIVKHRATMVRLSPNSKRQETFREAG